MKYISVEETAKKLNLSARSVRNYCRNNRIPGAVMSGKTWLIPENVKKPTRDDNPNMADVGNLLDFINGSPCSYYAIENVREKLVEAGYVEYCEFDDLDIKPGAKYFIVRNGSTLIAFNIGKDVVSNCGFHVIASHCDSPCFKVKPLSEGKTDAYNKINVSPYGGMIMSTWLDRPLGIAGRVLVNNGNKIESRLVNLTENKVFIPNLCIHFTRDLKPGTEFNLATDMQPFISMEGGLTLLDLVTSKLNITKEEIINFDLYLYNSQEGVIWGCDNEFISAPRLDDLECVYCSLTAFLQASNPTAINVLYIVDNEEVGSSSRQGAESDFLVNGMKEVCFGLNLSYEKCLGQSFIISADNAHAVHPNKPFITDDVNKLYMNKGIAIKFNAEQRYASDGYSSAVFQQLCKKAAVPYQFFSNRSDLKGGSTIGSIVLGHVSAMCVDVGLSQLAMHSCYETAGSLDINYAISVFREFYKSSIDFDYDGIIVR